VFIEILLIYIVFLSILILGSYYVDLYLSKDQFTKEELKDVLPYLLKLWRKVSHSFSMLLLAVILAVSSLLGILFPMVSQNWFLNSSIIFLTMFFSFPVLKRNFDKTTVTVSGSYADTAMNIFVKYHNIILVGFGAGTASGLIYNWGAFKAVHFLWFLVNLIVLSILTGMVIKNILHE
jgi:hypothetical protein